MENSNSARKRISSGEPVVLISAIASGYAIRLFSQNWYFSHIVKKK
ncbi:hypothetical protein HCH_03868 [Hahella chejuensis KCTC 2396]|uniref:Uncharacterized protein n=1 Tax=Hahella chejuensis (strain KCTC 2396) TaxID=349521 RepID=Q2SFH9_HAHCH|nr:hypothetical protein HCH_03868 [Hahella chejuensis KCTC 2396]